MQPTPSVTARLVLFARNERRAATASENDNLAHFFRAPMFFYYDYQVITVDTYHYQYSSTCFKVPNIICRVPFVLGQASVSHVRNNAPPADQ